MKLVTATFRTRSAAEEALTRLEAAGVRENQVSLIMSDSTRGRSFAFERGTKADEAAAAGGMAGGLIGAILGALLSAASIAIPGMNVVVTGTLVSGLIGLGAGAAMGGLAGALIGAGIPEVEAKLYENAVKEGNVLLAVKPENNEQRAMIRDILDDVSAYHVAA